MTLTLAQSRHNVKVVELIDAANYLKSDGNTNKEYDRALCELIAWVTPNPDGKETEEIVNNLVKHFFGGNNKIEENKK